MIKFLKNLLRRDDPRKNPRRSTIPVRPKPAQGKNDPREDSNAPEVNPQLEGRVETAGPGKNVLVRSKYQREDSGTHETLKIIDDRLVTEDNSGESGIDPYNTGQFDRSKNWDKRFRK